jgi:lipopolysaccharide transport system ATP-binding protein
MKPIIQVQNVSKQYRLGQVGTGSLSDDISRWWHRMRGKEDPFLKVGETNDRTIKTDNDYVWALRDINFELQAGEVLGIIGRNGAGKSTLLKILSRVAAPTTGSITMQGRVASLLEVGTGMHPDLTGRENIFLNGAILGMTKKDIRRQFDAIVDFAKVERYIDTPVKRYSSGMHVRLGFAVAAHLDPDILIVDEVLAVGDAEFQKKCLGKMKEVSNQSGKTILFVSHNMVAIKNLCPRTLLMDQGHLIADGPTADILQEYLSAEESEYHRVWPRETAPGTEAAKLIEAGLREPREVLYIDEPLPLHFMAELSDDYAGSRVFNFSLVFYTPDGVPVFNTISPSLALEGNRILGCCRLPANLLNDDHYALRILLVVDTSTHVFDCWDVLQLKLEERQRNADWHGKWIGLVRPEGIISWHTEEVL